MWRAWLATVGDVLVWWVVLVALYFAFITTVTVLECVVAGAGAALAALGAHRLRSVTSGGPGGRTGLSRALLAWPGTLVADLARLVVVTLRGTYHRGNASGRFRTVVLRAGVGAGWASALLSATPGAYVVDVRPQASGREDGSPGTTRGEVMTVHVLTGPASVLERALTRGRPS
jgi:hypothetical protein